jgi:hypothetical protein
MSALGPDAGGTLPVQSGSNGRSEISLTRIYLPFAMVITFGAFLVVAGYAVGGFMSGVARDKSETDTRLGAIEREVTAIKGILTDRMLTPNSCNCRSK